METGKKREFVARMIRMEDDDGSFDREFCQSRTTDERFAAAWQLVVHYLERHGRSDEQRLQRTVEHFYRAED